MFVKVPMLIIMRFDENVLETIYINFEGIVEGGDYMVHLILKKYKSMTYTEGKFYIFIYKYFQSMNKKNIKKGGPKGEGTNFFRKWV